MSTPLPCGTRVRWSGPGACLREYSGEIVCYVLAGASLSWTSRRYMGGLAHLVMCADFAFDGTRDLSEAPRYLIRTDEKHGEPEHWVYRVVSAALIENRNPATPTESP